MRSGTGIRLLIVLAVVVVGISQVSPQSEVPSTPSAKPLRKEAVTTAVSEPRKKRLRICSQNLFRLYEPPGPESREKRRKEKLAQERLLAARVAQANCDIVAVQEVVGDSKKAAEKNLNRFAVALRNATPSRRYRAYVADSLDHYIRNGFLVDASLGEVARVVSYAREPLPRLTLAGPSSRYVRGPLLVEVSLGSKKGRGFNKLILLTAHLKSKSNAWKDSTGTKFESQRLEMAEGLRTLVTAMQTEHPQAVVLLAVDRNADSEDASSEVLRGVLRLDDFRKGCAITAELRAACRDTPVRAPQLVPLVVTRSDEQNEALATYQYKKQHYILDELYVVPSAVRHFRAASGSLAVGTAGKFYKGSDHKLVYADMYW